MRELIDEVRKLLPQSRVELVPAAAGEKIIRRPQPLDLARSRAELGYIPEYPLPEALADYVRELGRLPGAGETRNG